MIMEIFSEMILQEGIHSRYEFLPKIFISYGFDAILITVLIGTQKWENAILLKHCWSGFKSLNQIYIYYATNYHAVR